MCAMSSCNTESVNLAIRPVKTRSCVFKVSCNVSSLKRPLLLLKSITCCSKGSCNGDVEFSLDDAAADLGRAVPVVRPGLAPTPCLYTSDLLWTTEVVLILGFIQPTALTSGLARPSAIDLRAIALACAITGIWVEETLAMTAFTADFHN